MIARPRIPMTRKTLTFVHMITQIQCAVHSHCIQFGMEPVAMYHQLVLEAAVPVGWTEHCEQWTLAQVRPLYDS